MKVFGSGIDAGVESETATNNWSVRQKRILYRITVFSRTPTTGLAMSIFFTKPVSNEGKSNNLWL
jgi:hypothetical protein